MWTAVIVIALALMVAAFVCFLESSIHRRP